MVSHVGSRHLRRKGFTHTDLFFFLGMVVSSCRWKIPTSCIIANVHRLRSRAAILNWVCLIFDRTPDPDASQSNAKLARCKTNGICFASAVLHSAWCRACQFRLFSCVGDANLTRRKTCSQSYMGYKVRSQGLVSNEGSSKGCLFMT